MLKTAFGHILSFLQKKSALLIRCEQNVVIQKTLHSNFRCLSGSFISGAREIQLNPMDTLFIQNIAEKREHQCGDDVVYIKTGTKAFAQNNYQHCTRISQKRVKYLESHLKLL